MILNVRIRFIIVLGDGPHIVMSRKNGDDILTPCTLKTVTDEGRNALGFLVDVVFHNPQLKDE